MQRPPLGLSTQTCGFSGEDDRRESLGEEDDIEHEDEACQDQREVFGPAPAEVALSGCAADDGAV